VGVSGHPHDEPGEADEGSTRSQSNLPLDVVSQVRWANLFFGTRYWKRKVPVTAPASLENAVIECK